MYFNNTIVNLKMTPIMYVAIVTVLPVLPQLTKLMKNEYPHSLSILLSIVSISKKKLKMHNSNKFSYASF